MKSWATIFLLFLIVIGCSKRTPLPTRDTALYALEYGQLPTPNIPSYNDHGLQMSPTLDQALVMTAATGLMLSEQDKDDLEAFLRTLTDYELISNERYSSPF